MVIICLQYAFKYLNVFIYCLYFGIYKGHHLVWEWLSLYVSMHEFFFVCFFFFIFNVPYFMYICAQAPPWKRGCLSQAAYPANTLNLKNVIFNWKWKNGLSGNVLGRSHTMWQQPRKLEHRQSNCIKGQSDYMHHGWTVDMSCCVVNFNYLLSREFVRKIHAVRPPGKDH